MESPGKDLESQIEGFLEQVKQSAVRAMEDLPSDGWLTNENIVHTILKRSRSDISSSDDGTLHSADFGAIMEEKNYGITSPETPNSEAVQYWSNYQEVQPTLIWKLDSNSEFVQMPVEYTVVSQALQTEASQELSNENKVMFVRNTPNTSYSPSYATEEIVEEDSGKTESSFDSGDIEVDVGNDNYPPETVEVVKKKTKTRRKPQNVGVKKRKNLVKLEEKAKTAGKGFTKSNLLKDDELTRLEDNAEQVAERFRLGCDCGEGCFDNFNAEKVFRHKLNIADLTKAEHDMYLMGVIHSSMQNPEETRRKKGRLRQRNSYAYDGKRVCLTAFLYLEHVTLYQIKRIRKHLRNHGVSPRIHGNHGRKPFNTLPLDIYQHATHFVQTFIEQHVKTYYEDGENLAVRDVYDLLRSQYAIITGGKTDSGYPIISFPDIGNFSTLGDAEYQRLMLYLTAVPSMQEADAGFVLVIDRRSDRWNSVKPTLLKLSGYFPGLVHVAYVLRPSGLIKKTISDVLNKLFKEDFKFKVVICNNLEELHSYIDKSQLTPDLGGSLQYTHADWILERERLEKLSSVMRDVSAKLDAYTRKLEDTPLPDDETVVHDLIAAQETEYGELKEIILDAAKEGETLLDAFRKNQPFMQADHTGQIVLPESDKLGNVAAVERLLVQLEETDRTFSEFHSEHAIRVRQHMEHRLFLKNVEELTEKFNEHLSIVGGMVEIGETVDRVDSLVKETNSFHKIAMTDIERAEEVISNGQQLLKSRQFSSLETLQTDCDALKKLAIILTERIEHRLDGLKKHRELQEHIDTANAWCARGVELLSNQHVEKTPVGQEIVEKTISGIRGFLESGERLELNGPDELFKDSITPETRALVTQVLQRIADVSSMCEKRLASLEALVAKKPVQTVCPEPGVPLQPAQSAPILIKSRILKKANTVAKLEDPWNQNKPRLVEEPVPTLDPAILQSKRDHILSELLETEKVYVNEMDSIISGYQREMESPEKQSMLPAALIGKVDVLFGNWTDIYAFHSNTFLRDLQNCISNTELVALCFTHRKTEFYKLYSIYCQNSPRSEQLRAMIGERDLFFSACQMKLGHKLPLAAYLLKPIQRITKYQLLLKDLLRCSEDPKCRVQLQEALECMLVVLKCVNDGMHQIAITGFRGDLSEQGDLLMQGSFSIWTESKKIRELRLSPMQRHVFLYRKAILFCKKENKEYNKATYHFKRCLKMSQVGLTESVKGDVRKFEIWLQGRQEVHTIQAATLEQKNTWVQQIKQVLLEQLAELRGANMRQYSLNKMPLVHRPLRQTTSWESQSSMESSAGSSNRAFSCDESSAIHHQTLHESGEESSDNSVSEEEDTFHVNSAGGKYLVQADYKAQSHTEVSLQEGDYVEILKIGCGGWWYVKARSYQGQPVEGWAPSAYMEPTKKRHEKPSQP